MKLTPAILALAAAIAVLPAARAGSLDEDAPGWRKPRYDRPIYVPQRAWAPPPDPYRGASLVPPMTNTYVPPPRHDFRGFGHGFAPHQRSTTVIIINRSHGGHGARPAMIGGARR